MKILFIGDIVGSPGRKAVKEVLATIKAENNIDFVVANGENSAAGSGITYHVAQELYKMGIHFITLGNHTFAKREIHHFIETEDRIIRPSNYAPGLPGRGSRVVQTPRGKVGILNLLGRVYMDPVDCPFRKAEEELEKLKEQTKVILVDFHAEATSEKCSLAWHLDGRVSAVVGTHTHVQTADERILPCGTAFITDVGMTGPRDGIIGVEKDIVIEKFLTGFCPRFEVATGDVLFNAVVLDIDEQKGRANSIQRINKTFQITA